MLKEDGVELKVLYSDPLPSEADKHDKIDLPPEFGIKVKGHWFLNNKLLYQSASKEIFKADLVICQQEAKYVWIYPLIVLSALGVKPFGLWGLGQFKEPDQPYLAKYLRDWMISKVDWWFAYTRETSEYLISRGMSSTAITVVQNAVDTRYLQDAVAAVSAGQVADARRMLGIPQGAQVGLYVGILSAVKQLPFLVESAIKIREQAETFHLLIAGAGPERAYVEELARQHSWIHYVGPIFGKEKALYCKISDICLIPGRVGLAILDAFAGGMPLATTELPNHGPEIEYLRSGFNGIMAPHDIEAYSEVVVRLLRDQSQLALLRSGANESAGMFTVEAMAQNFREGVLKALGMRNGFQPSGAPAATRTAKLS